MQQEIDFKLARALLGLSNEVLGRLMAMLQERGFRIDGVRRVSPLYVDMTPVLVINAWVHQMYPAGLPTVSGRIPQTIGELISAQQFDPQLCEFTVVVGCREASMHQRRIDRVKHDDDGDLSLERVAC